MPVPALLRFWDSLNSAGTGTIEGIIDSYGGVFKLFDQMQCVSAGRDLRNIGTDTRASPRKSSRVRMISGTALQYVFVESKPGCPDRHAV